MAYQRKDCWYRKAKQEGYRSRAAYKLLELDERHNIFKSGARVLDLGCAPGGWLQVAATKVGAKGRLVGIDRDIVEPLRIPNVTVIVGDITDPSTCARLFEVLGAKANLMLSDMAPDTSGVGFADHLRSMELVHIAFSLTDRLLEHGGTMVAKVFDGPEMSSLINRFGKDFGKMQRVHLKSTRKGSREFYLVARPYLPNPNPET